MTHSTAGAVTALQHKMVTCWLCKLAESWPLLLIAFEACRVRFRTCGTPDQAYLMVGLAKAGPLAKLVTDSKSSSCLAFACVKSNLPAIAAAIIELLIVDA